MTRNTLLRLACASLCLATGGCATVCPKTWETGVEASHSLLYGPIYGTHVTIGGDIGKECRDNPDAGDD